MKSGCRNEWSIWPTDGSHKVHWLAQAALWWVRQRPRQSRSRGYRGQQWICHWIQSLNWSAAIKHNLWNVFSLLLLHLSTVDYENVHTLNLFSTLYIADTKTLTLHFEAYTSHRLATLMRCNTQIKSYKSQHLPDLYSTRIHFDRSCFENQKRKWSPSESQWIFEQCVILQQKHDKSGKVYVAKLRQFSQFKIVKRQNWFQNYVQFELLENIVLLIKVNRKKHSCVFDYKANLLLAVHVFHSHLQLRGHCHRTATALSPRPRNPLRMCPLSHVHVCLSKCQEEGEEEWW